MKSKKIRSNKPLNVAIAIVFFLFSTSLIAQEVNKEEQWNFFKSIPQFKSIELEDPYSNSSEKGFSINDKYQVTISWIIDKGNNLYGQGTETTYVKYNGHGSLIWSGDHMELKLSIEASGYYNYYRERPAYTSYESALGGLISVPRRHEAKTIAKQASGSASFEKTFQVQYDPDDSSQSIFISPSTTMKLYLTGSESRTYSMDVGGWYRINCIRKSENEINSMTDDEFGEWKWDESRSKIYLKSQNSTNSIVVWNNNGDITFGLELDKNAGGTSEDFFDNKKVEKFGVAFDGDEGQLFSFMQYEVMPQISKYQVPVTVKSQIKDSLLVEESSSEKDSIVFVEKVDTTYMDWDNFVVKNTDMKSKILMDYVTYNRFTGKVIKNALPFLNQMKDRQILLLTYKVNNEERTDMFSLEGLGAILDALNDFLVYDNF